MVCASDNIIDSRDVDERITELHDNLTIAHEEFSGDDPFDEFVELLGSGTVESLLHYEDDAHE